MEKIVYPNGLRVLFMPQPGARCTAIECWIAAGARYETAREAGISHFCEHILFKGTATRTARQISEETDTLGADVNAYTYKEYTRLCAQVIPENADACLGVLLDMLCHPAITAEAVALERRVILDEIDLYDDIGEETAHDALCAAAYPGSPLGRPICGTRESVSRLTERELRRYMHDNYTPERMIVVIAGQFDRVPLEKRLADTLGTRPRGGGCPAADHPVFVPGQAVREKDFSQLSLEWGFAGLPTGDPLQYALMLLNFIIGNSASSRLFLRLREEAGLVYSVESAHDDAKNAGLFTVSAAVSPQNARQVMDEVPRILRELADSGVTAGEFARAKAQAKAAYIFDLETVPDIAYYGGYHELTDGGELPVETVLAALSAVTRDEVNALARRIFTAPFAFSAAGPVGDLLSKG